MGRRVRAYLAAALGLSLAALAGFGLPGLLLAAWDEQQLGRVEQGEAPRLVISEQPELTIVEKVRLLQRDSSNSMPLQQGKNYRRDTVEEKMMEELDALAAIGIEGLPAGELDVAFAEVFFVMDVEGEHSCIIWNAQLYQKEGAAGSLAELYLDDETGKILSLSCYGLEGLTAESVEDVKKAESLIYDFADYLDCHVAMTDMTDLAGLGYTGVSAAISYGDESGLEMQYQFYVSREEEVLFLGPYYDVTLIAVRREKNLRFLGGFSLFLHQF